MTPEPGGRNGPDGEARPGDLAARVIAASQAELARLRARTLRRRALAAALVGTLIGGALFSVRVGHERAILADRDLITARLQSDGRFDPQSWTGPAGSEVSLHALALLAMARADDVDPASRRGELLRGATWLLEQQAPDGDLGQPGSSGQDHALATLALLEVYGRTGADELLRGARCAVTHLAQSSRQGTSPWDLAALERAQALQVSDHLAAPIARARRQLGGQPGGGALERAALEGLGPLASAEFGLLPAAAAAVLGAVTTAR